MATYSIQAPDGNTYQIAGPEGASQQQVQAEVLRQNPQAGQAKATQAAPSGLDSALGTLKNIFMGGTVGPLEAGAHIASSAAAVPVSGIAGLGQAANNALGVGDGRSAADAVSQTQDALTYNPRSDAGKAIVGTAGKVLGPVGEAINSAGEKASETTGSPAYGAATSALATALPDILGVELPSLGKARIASKTQEAVDAAPRQAQVDAARQAGYHLPPTEVTGASAGQLATGVAGKDQLNAALSLTNQKVTNRIAKAEAGVPDNVPFTKDALNTEATNAGKAYEAVKTADQNLTVARDANGNIIRSASGKPMVKRAGAVTPDATYAADIKNIGADSENASFGTRIDPQVEALKQQYANSTGFTPRDGVNSVKDLRFQSKANLKATDDPAKLALGKAQMQTADAIEDQISRYLDKTGQSNLFKTFEAERTRLAKINTIRDAMDASGNVDAEAINAYRNNGGKVSGGLKQIADASDSFGKVVRNTQGVQAPAPFSAFDFGLKSAGLAGGAAAGGGALYGHTGAAAAGGLTALSLAARPAARGAINSDFYQSLLHGRSPQAGALARLAAQPGSPLAGLLVTPGQADSQ